MKLNFQKNKVISDKTPFFVRGQFCTPHSICLFGFCKDSFVRKYCVFNRSTFNQKTLLHYFKKGFRFPEKLFQMQNNENVQNLQ